MTFTPPLTERAVPAPRASEMPAAAAGQDASTWSSPAFHTKVEQGILSAVPEAAPLVDEIGRVVGLGGKRLRPAFCYWGFRAASGEHSAGIVRVGSALELLHTFALVHDDIMDEAETRRGEPSTYVAHDADFALLAGDLALVLADAAFSRTSCKITSFQGARLISSSSSGPTGPSLPQASGAWRERRSPGCGRSCRAGRSMCFLWRRPRATRNAGNGESSHEP